MSFLDVVLLVTMLRQFFKATVQFLSRKGGVYSQGQPSNSTRAISGSCSSSLRPPLSIAKALKPQPFALGTGLLHHCLIFSWQTPLQVGLHCFCMHKASYIPGDIFGGHLHLG